MTDVSVIVPVYNAPDEYVATCVEGLLRQECRRFSYEIILVDDGSSEPLTQQLRRLGFSARRAVTCVTTTHGGPAVARSAGMQVARGDLIALTDIDCVPRPDWLARYVEALTDSTVDAAGGLTVSYSVGTLVERYCDHFGSLRRPLVRGDMRLLIGCNACWRARTLRLLGGCHQGYRDYAEAGLVFKGFEDLELSVRAARHRCRIVVVDDAVVAHRHRRRIAERMRQFACYGAGYAAFLRLCSDAPPDLTRYAISPADPLPDAMRSIVREAVRLPLRLFRENRDLAPMILRIAYPAMDYVQRVAFYAGFWRASRQLMQVSELSPTRSMRAPACDLQ